MKAKYMMIAALAAVMAGCSNEENAVTGGQVALQVNAEIGGMTTSRASGTSWTDGDEIGIYERNEDGTVDGTRRFASNVKYTKSGTGFTSTTPIYFERSPSYFKAYYPFQGESGDITITAADQTEANQPKIDFMYAAGLTPVNMNNPTVNFVFKHIMSQLILTFKAGNGVDNLNNLTAYTVKNLQFTGEITPAAGETSTTGLYGDLTLPLSDVTGTSYTAFPVILFPQGVIGKKFDIEVTLDGQTYKGTLNLPDESDNQFKSGYSISYTVTINKTGLTVGTAIITDWSDGGTGSGTVTM